MFSAPVLLGAFWGNGDAKKQKRFKMVYFILILVYSFRHVYDKIKMDFKTKGKKQL
jgi:hypothetical protein